MKKLLSLVCTLALLTVALSSCGAKLPDGMSEENVLAAANNVVAFPKRRKIRGNLRHNVRRNAYCHKRRSRRCRHRL
ncbi:MAG: hypothetical protein RR635_02465 [Oscillospiraceae bacterium]